MGDTGTKDDFLGKGEKCFSRQKPIKREMSKTKSGSLEEVGG